MGGDDQRLQIMLLSSPFELRTWRLFALFLYHSLVAQSADNLNDVNQWCCDLQRSMVFLGRDDGGVGYVETVKAYR